MSEHDIARWVELPTDGPMVRMYDQDGNPVEAKITTMQITHTGFDLGHGEPSTVAGSIDMNGKLTRIDGDLECYFFNEELVRDWNKYEKDPTLHLYQFQYDALTRQSQQQHGKTLEELMGPRWTIKIVDAPDANRYQPVIDLWRRWLRMFKDK